MSVVVVKLGVGNTAAVMFALERLSAKAVLTDEPERIADAERVILPGVGAAAYAMECIEQRGLRRVLTRFPRPLLGICLGQQLLFERSEEGDARGLGLLPGDVKRMQAPVLPHMGWSRLKRIQQHPLLEGVHDGDYVYFVHSFACAIDDFTLLGSDYGSPFAAAVARGNVMGCQFHPERSGATGARILANFLALPC